MVVATRVTMLDTMLVGLSNQTNAEKLKGIVETYSAMSEWQEVFAQLNSRGHWLSCRRIQTKWIESVRIPIYFFIMMYIMHIDCNLYALGK